MDLWYNYCSGSRYQDAKLVSASIPHAHFSISTFELWINESGRPWRRVSLDLPVPKMWTGRTGWLPAGVTGTWKSTTVREPSSHEDIVFDYFPPFDAKFLQILWLAEGEPDEECHRDTRIVSHFLIGWTLSAYSGRKRTTRWVIPVISVLLELCYVIAEVWPTTRVSLSVQLKCDPHHWTCPTIFV